MTLQPLRDLEQRWRNAATCRGDLGEQETLEACADELAAVRRTLEARLDGLPKIALFTETSFDIDDAGLPYSGAVSQHHELAIKVADLAAYLDKKEPA